MDWGRSWIPFASVDTSASTDWTLTRASYSLATTLLSTMGWAIFGTHWTDVQNAGSKIIGLSAGLAALMVLQALASAFSPIACALVWIGNLVFWTLRWLVTWGHTRPAKDKNGSRGSLQLYGPGVSRYPETSLLRQIKAEAVRVRIVIRVDDEVAECEIDPTMCSSINRFGMNVGFTKVLQCTSKRFTRRLKDCGNKVHLCRGRGCPDEGVEVLHVPCYGRLEAEQVVNVYELQRKGATAWALNKMAAWILRVMLFLPRLLYRCLCCRRRPGRTEVLLPRGPKEKPSEDSESEVDDVVEKCMAHQVRWEGETQAEVLASGPCSSGETRKQCLLEADRQGVRGDSDVQLCPLHQSLYLTSRWGLKCPVEGCQRIRSREIGGIRLCAAHADEERLRRRSPWVHKPGETPKQARDRVDVGQSTAARLARTSRGPPSERECGTSEVTKSGKGVVTSAATDNSPGTVKQNRTRMEAMLAGLEFGEGSRSRDQTPGGQTGLVNRYLELREVGANDGDAVSTLASDLEIPEADAQAMLIEEAKGLRDSGQPGLEGLLRHWTSPREESRRGVRAQERSNSSASWQVVPDGLRVRRPSESLPPQPLASTVGQGAPYAGPAVGRVERGRSPFARVDLPGLAPGGPPPLPSPPPIAGDMFSTSVPPSSRNFGGVGPGGSARLYDSLLGGTLGGGGRRSGAEDDATQRALRDVANAVAEQSQDLATLARCQLEEKRVSRGTARGLGREEEELVLLARACDQYTVAVCPGSLGRHLFVALKAAAVGAGGALRHAGWGQCMTNRLAIGVAGGYWGGRTEDAADKFALLPSDFIPTTSQELDEFIVPTDENAGDRPRQPVLWDDWLRRAHKLAAIWSLVYGAEWRTPLDSLVTDLERIAEEHPQVFPKQELRNIFSELLWRFWEELRETLRRLKQEVGRDQIRRSDLILFALTPDAQGRAWLRLPDVFDLSSPTGWFRTSILPRIERRQHRAVWGLTWQDAAGGSQKKSGLVRAGGEEGKNTDKLYPAGKLLTPYESKAANENKPLDREGKPLCWAALTHLGCTKTAKECGRSHASLMGKLGDLHWTVQAQLLRRGGLRSAKAVPPGEIDGRIAQLRAVAKTAAEAAAAEGRALRAAGGATEGAAAETPKEEAANPEGPPHSGGRGGSRRGDRGRRTAGSLSYAIAAGLRPAEAPQVKRPTEVLELDAEDLKDQEDIAEEDIGLTLLKGTAATSGPDIGELSGSASEKGATAADQAPPNDSKSQGALRASAPAWNPPEELANLDLTAAEEDLRGFVQGPDEHWGNENRGKGIPCPLAPDVPQEYQDYAERLADVDLPDNLKGTSSCLAAYVASRLALEPDQEARAILEDLATYGVGEVAAEAASVLDREFPNIKCGANPEVSLGATAWPKDGLGPGRADAWVLGEKWTAYDYGEMLQMTEPLAALIGEPEPGEERRQCLVKSVSASLILDVTEKVPSLQQAETVAQQIRLDLAERAFEAEKHLGEPEDRVSAIENEVRTHAHDACKPHHDKDFRALACLPPEALAAYVLVVLRVDYAGHLIVETVSGRKVEEPVKYLWTVLSRGHMRMLQLPVGLDPGSWLRNQKPASGVTLDAPALGWEFYLARAVDDPTTAPGTIARTCRCCQVARAATRYRPRLVGGEQPEDVYRPRRGTVLAGSGLIDAMKEPTHPTPIGGG